MINVHTNILKESEPFFVWTDITPWLVSWCVEQGVLFDNCRWLKLCFSLQTRSKAGDQKELYTKRQGSAKCDEKVLENPGIDPGTSHMQSERSTIWATPPWFQIKFTVVLNCNKEENVEVYFPPISKKLNGKLMLFGTFVKGFSSAVAKLLWCSLRCTIG